MTVLNTKEKINEKSINSEFITPRQAFELSEENKALLIDLREPEEYQGVFLDKAYLAPLSLIERMPFGVNKKNPVVFYCNNGSRTAKARYLLNELGFAKTYLMKGGLQDWLAEDLPIEYKPRLELSLSRQVQIFVAILCLISLSLAILNLNFLWIAVLVLVEELLAATTGNWALAFLLAIMPWNKRILKEAGSIAVEERSGLDIESEQLPEQLSEQLSEQLNNAFGLLKEEQQAGIRKKKKRRVVDKSKLPDFGGDCL